MVAVKPRAMKSASSSLVTEGYESKQRTASMSFPISFLRWNVDLQIAVIFHPFTFSGYCSTIQLTGRSRMYFFVAPKYEFTGGSHCTFDGADGRLKDIGNAEERCVIFVICLDFSCLITLAAMNSDAAMFSR